jgi:hypothetical protein
MLEAWVGPPVLELHEVEINRETVLAFWRLGLVLARNEPRDREVFSLGRCIGNTPGTTATLHAFGDRDDPSSFALSKLLYGGDQPMLDAYWHSVENPVVFDLARQVYQHASSIREKQAATAAEEGGVLIFDVSADHARLAGIRYYALS